VLPSGGPSTWQGVTVGLDGRGSARSNWMVPSPSESGRAVVSGRYRSSLEDLNLIV
jgi:hypothetical protein